MNIDQKLDATEYISSFSSSTGSISSSLLLKEYTQACADLRTLPPSVQREIYQSLIVAGITTLGIIDTKSKIAIAPHLKRALCLYAVAQEEFEDSDKMNLAYSLEAMVSFYHSLPGTNSIQSSEEYFRCEAFLPFEKPISNRPYVIV